MSAVAASTATPMNAGTSHAGRCAAAGAARELGAGGTGAGDGVGGRASLSGGGSVAAGRDAPDPV